MVDRIARRLLAAVEQQQVDGVLLAQLLAELIACQPTPGGESALSETATPEARLEAALLHCARQIAALQQTIADLATHTPQRQENAALHERLASIESRVIEQESAIRHTLTTLIDWIERDEACSVAS